MGHGNFTTGIVFRIPVVKFPWPYTTVPSSLKKKKHHRHSLDSPWFGLS